MTDAVQNDGTGPYLIRDPRSRLPVTCDWSAWLAQEGTTILSSVWTADTGIVLDTPSFTTLKATVFVSGGLADHVYAVRNTITTANGLIDARAFRVGVRDR